MFGKSDNFGSCYLLLSYVIKNIYTLWYFWNSENELWRFSLVSPLFCHFLQCHKNKDTQIGHPEEEIPNACSIFIQIFWNFGQIYSDELRIQRATTYLRLTMLIYKSSSIFGSRISKVLKKKGHSSRFNWFPSNDIDWWVQHKGCVRFASFRFVKFLSVIFWNPSPPALLGVSTLPQVFFSTKISCISAKPSSIPVLINTLFSTEEELYLVIAVPIFSIPIDFHSAPQSPSCPATSCLLDYAIAVNESLNPNM